MPFQGERNAGMKETNNHAQGRSDAKVKINQGPASGGSLAGNSTNSGGINRATKPTKQN